MRLRPFRILVFACSVVFLAACASRPAESLILREMEFSDVFPRWPEPLDAPLNAFRESCRTLPRETITVAGKTVTPQAWRNACRKAELSQSAENPGEFFRETFTPYQALTAQHDAGLLTGYYEPLLYGSLAPDDRFRYPVWSVPSDFHAPYLTRKEIDRQGLRGRAEPLLYVDDPIDLFFLHVQGSGRVALPDKRVMQIAYAGKNQRPYTAIGKILIERGEIPAAEMTAQRLKAWLREHPEQAAGIMWQNESYVFFTLRETRQNAIGAEGVPLTPEASLAVDPDYIPYGTPVYVETPSNYRKLAIAQDTGSAIKGALRGDMFFGPGERAEELAGKMKEWAHFYILLPKDGSLR